MNAPVANYDFREPFYRYAPGLVMTREIEASMSSQYIANGYTPLTQAQVLAITGPLPPFPAGMVRLADSNPATRDGWSIDNQGTPP